MYIQTKKSRIRMILQVLQYIFTILCVQYSPSSWSVWMHNTQLAKEVTKLPLTECLGKNISKLLRGSSIAGDNSTGSELFSNKMTIHLDMLGTFMKDGVGGDM